MFFAAQVREGLDESGSFVGRFCGNVTPPIYTSTQNNLWIKFQSDISVGGSGFRATWDVGEFHQYYDIQEYCCIQC